MVLAFRANVGVQIFNKFSYLLWLVIQEFFANNQYDSFKAFIRNMGSARKSDIAALMTGFCFECLHWCALDY